MEKQHPFDAGHVRWARITEEAARVAAERIVYPRYAESRFLLRRETGCALVTPPEQLASALASAQVKRSEPRRQRVYI